MAKLLSFVFLVCATFCVVISKHEIYEGYSFYEVSAADSAKAAFVNSLENSIDIDIFSYVHPARPGYILVPGNLKQHFEQILSTQGIGYNVQVQNMREQLEQEDQLLASAAMKRKARSRFLDFDQIHSLEAVDAYLDRLGAEYPDIVTVVNSGKSFEGRDIKHLRISTTNFEDRNKPVIFIMSLLHSREWITLPVTLYAIEQLLSGEGDRDLLETMDWIILPVANPDGYEYTHTTDRFWRKNRATGYVENDTCLGVDLNRNFESPFWGTASSDDVCLNTFHGSHAFSEPETANIRDIILSHRDRMAYFGDIHSFGSMILFSMGNGDLPSNALVLNLNAVYQARAIDAVKWESKRNYVVGNFKNVLYAGSGISIDYVTNNGVPFSYLFELPAFNNTSGVNGFLVDPEFIWQAGFETWEGIKVGARFARDLYWG